MAISISNLERIDFSDVVESGAASIPPTHPGEILWHDFMEPLALTADTLASALNIPADRLNGVLAKTQAIVPDLALRIARYFGTSAELWSGLQASYDLQEARRVLGADIERQVAPRRAADGIQASGHG